MKVLVNEVAAEYGIDGITANRRWKQRLKKG